MNKRAYDSAPIGEEAAPIKSRITNLSEGLSSTETGGRGVDSIVEHSTSFPNPEDDEMDEEDLADLFISLGDDMDVVGEEVLANFADFMLIKIAETRDLDYSELFNQLMIKINNADLVNTNEILKKLAKIYSRTLSLEFLKNQDLDKSKKSAYKKTLHRADQYLSE
jgi:hypothetical protein